METDLLNFRRWLFEDFKVRVSLLVPPLLEANPEMEAFDLMAAIEAAEAPIPLGPDRKAFLLDQYIVTRWAGGSDPSPLAQGCRHPRKPKVPRSRRVRVPG